MCYSNILEESTTVFGSKGLNYDVCVKMKCQHVQ